MHPRQQVAVACWAMNTGCPFMGVCLPSFRIVAGAIRFAIKSLAWDSIVSNPFCSIYRRSFSPNRKRLRNSDFANRSKTSSYILRPTASRYRIVYHTGRATASAILTQNPHPSTVPIREMFIHRFPFPAPTPRQEQSTGYPGCWNRYAARTSRTSSSMRRYRHRTS